MDADLSELRQALVQDCGLAPARAVPGSRDDLIEELARRVDDLLRHNPEKLSFYLYTLDVSEDIVADAFTTGSANRPARLIAEAILKREAERLHTRRRYTRPDTDQLSG